MQCQGVGERVHGYAGSHANQQNHRVWLEWIFHPVRHQLLPSFFLTIFQDFFRIFRTIQDNLGYICPGFRAFCPGFVLDFGGFSGFSGKNSGQIQDNFPILGPIWGLFRAFRAKKAGQKSPKLSCFYFGFGSFFHYCSFYFFVPFNLEGGCE